VAPFTVAEIVVLPECAPVTSPLLETEATLLFALDQLTFCAATSLPASSCSVADSCCVLPATRPIEPGATTTLETPPAST
jgi:hypothetical protein